MPLSSARQINSGSQTEDDLDLMLKILSEESPLKTYLLFDNDGKVIRYSLSKAVKYGPNRNGINEELRIVREVANEILPKYLAHGAVDIDVRICHRASYFCTIKKTDSDHLICSVLSENSAICFANSINILFSDRLTKREIEIIRLLFMGKSTADISTDLNVTPHTVRQHLKSVFSKTGTNSQNQLILKIAFAYL